MTIDQTWTWQQSGARANKARATYQFFQQSTTDFVAPEDWPFKSPDLTNVMDYSVWSLLLTELQNCWHNSHSIDDLKTSLGRV